jgi:hypothetical protein
MAAAFPELKRVRGYCLAIHHHYFAGMLYDHSHWWLLDEAGKVVDPTASQYARIEAYNPIDEATFREPSGKCMNCGELVYPPRRNFCDDTCEQAVLGEMNSGL